MNSIRSKKSLNHFRSELITLKKKKKITVAAEEFEASDEKARSNLQDKERQQAEAQRRVSQLHNAIREADTSIRITKEKIQNEEKVIKEYSKDIEQGEIDLKELMDLLANSRKKPGIV